MGYEYRIIAPAINKALILRRELLKAYSNAGVNIVKVIQSSVKFNMSLAKTKFALKALYDSVGSRFFGILTKQSDVFREKLYKNMPKILNVLESFVKFVFKAFEATTQLGGRLWEILSRVYDFFVKLDTATNHWSTIILGLIAAWKLLNLSFLATPLGLLLSLGVAVLALYDDFKTFQEGGKSFFNWENFIPIIENVTSLIKSLTDTLNSLFQVVYAIADAFWRLLNLDLKGFWNATKLGAESVWEVFKKIGDAVKRIISLGGDIGKRASKLFGDNPEAAATPVIKGNSAPLGSQTNNNNQTNQHVQQQTAITINGSADANSVGKAVAGEQSRINYDMIRNMRGSVR